MTLRIMMTEGNNVHPVDYHAEVTAEKIIGELETSIISVASSATPATVTAARSLRKAIEKILIAHHQKVHDHEQGKLAEHGLARLDQPMATDGLVDEAGILADIAGAAKGSPFEAFFNGSHEKSDAVRQAIIGELHHESRSQMNVHRLVHARAQGAS